jgi:hypothetical protein
MAAPFDLVIDSIGFNADDARQDLECFADLTRHLVFISTDFVLLIRHFLFFQQAFSCRDLMRFDPAKG